MDDAERAIENQCYNISIGFLWYLTDIPIRHSCGYTNDLVSSVWED
jgi:hypothetical protein